MEDRPIAYTRWLSFHADGVSNPDVSHWASLKPDRTYRVSVLTDTALHRLSVSVNGQEYFAGRLPGSSSSAPQTLQSELGGSPLPVTVVARPVPMPALCKSLIDRTR
jgi:hypothetical protein